MKVTPSSTLYMLGSILLVALTICSWGFGDRGGPLFMASLVVAEIAYLLAVREIFKMQSLARRTVVIALVLAGAWHIAFLRVPPGNDDDVHRYVWDGRLQKLGYDPYRVVPSDPAVQPLHTDETRTLNNPDLPSPYPPGAQLFFRGITAIHESVFAFKVAFVLCELVIIFVLADVLRRTSSREHLVLVFAWNPLLAIEVAGSGHIDIVGALLLVISAAALVRRWRAVAAIAFALAVAVKFLPIVLLPLYWKRVRIRDGLLAIAVVALMYLPFVHEGRIPLGSVGTYVQTFRFNGPVFAALTTVFPPQALIVVTVLAGILSASWIRRRSAEVTLDAFAWPMAIALLCAPAVFPWYLLWLLPFLTSVSTLLIVVWTVAVIPTYIQWHLRAVGHPWGALPGWIMLVEYAAVAAAGAILLRQRLTRRNAFQASAD